MSIDTAKTTDTAVSSGAAVRRAAPLDRKPFFVILNSSSGHGDVDAACAAIESVLAISQRPFELLPVRDGSELPRIASRAVDQARRRHGIVVAAGGDGTLNTVCEALIGTGVPLGVVPLGTFNYFARNQGLPLNTEEATRALLDACIEPVQVGELNHRMFLVNASLGLYPQLLEDRETYKRRLGRNRLVALVSALVTLLHAHRTLVVQIETKGESINVWTVSLVVANNALQLEHVGVELGSALRRGRLVAMMVKPMGTLALYGLLLRGLLRRLGEAENLDSFSFTQMSVCRGRGRRIKVALDGEVSWMRLPLQFNVAAHTLPLLVPRDPLQRKRS
ncbi:MAG: hypothetical protein KDI01_07745 [Halioglobus sp.]|nr:hypothetical protein [Halioglobus sp.]